ncbi:hypothetical protein ABPG72_013042 [Tetrahymena utriculariae]
MNFIEKIEYEIEKYFHSSGVKEGYETLQNDFKQYTFEKNSQFQDIRKHLETLQQESLQTEIKIISDNQIKDACFLYLDEISLIGVVSKNQIYVFYSSDSASSNINLMSQHTIQFNISDNPFQYQSYPKSKQKIVNFVKGYRESVFPKTEEDLYSCDFFDLHLEKSIQTGIIAGGITGFIHFVDIQSSTNQICFQVHGDTIFDLKSLNRKQSCQDYKNIIVSASKDGSIFLSHLAKQEKLIQLKDFLSTSPMSQFTCIDIDLACENIFSACGDGTIQIWHLSESIKKILLLKSPVNNFVKIEKSQYNYQVQAQEDIMHTVQVTQCNFYGKYLLYLNSQGYITLGTFIEPYIYKAQYRMRKFDKDNTGKNLKFFQIANFDLGSKIENYNKVMHVDQKNGLVWIGKQQSIFCFDLKERRNSEIDYNYSKPLIAYNTFIKANIQKIFFNEGYTVLYILTDEKQLIKFSFILNK